MTSFLASILVSAIFGGAVGFAVFALFRYPVPAEPPIHRRIATAMGVGERQTVFENAILQPIMSIGLGLARRCNLANVRKRIGRNLNASGNPNGYSIEEYFAICIVTSMTLGFLTLLTEFMFISGMAIIMVPLAMLIGFAIPYYAINSAAHKRTLKIAKQLPYTLDLIALTMAAGSTFTEAIETVIRDNPQEDLNQELAIVEAEISFGTTRAQSLRNLASRIPLETLRSIIGAIIQAEDLGTPLSGILKEQSTILRNRRSIRAEKLSASASLRILVPSMLILLAAVLVVFAPAVMIYVQRGSLF